MEELFLMERSTTKGGQRMLVKDDLSGVETKLSGVETKPWGKSI